MFCPRCGNRFENNSLFCPECGCKLESEANFRQNNNYNNNMQPQGYARNPQPYYNKPAAPSYPVNQRQRTRKKSKKPIVIGISATTTVILIFICIFVLWGSASGSAASSGTPEATISKLETALNDLNMSEALECYSSEAQSDISTFTSSFNTNWGSYTKDMVDFKLSGSNFNYSTGDDGKEYCSCDLYEECTVTVLGQESTQSDTESVTFVKEDGEWLITI